MTTAPLPLAARVQHPRTAPIPIPGAIPLPGGLRPESAWTPFLLGVWGCVALGLALTVLTWWIS